MDAYGWALMVLLVAVPGLAAVKLVALIGTVLVATFRHRFRGFGLAVGLTVIASLTVATLVGTFNEVPPADRLNHLVRVASFYAVFAAVYWVRRAFDTGEKLDRLCLSIATMMAGTKIAILATVIAFDLSLSEVLGFLGLESVTLLIGFNILRLQFPSDFVTLFLLAAYQGRRSVRRDGLFVLAVAIVIFLSFSRFIFVCFFAGLAIRALWLRRFDTIAVIGCVVLAGTFAVFGNELVERFVGEGSAVSDETRTEQTDALTNDFELHPLLGRGIGGSVPDFKRSESLPFSYEVQWYATGMQFGLVGTAVLVLCVLSIVLGGLRDPRSVLCVLLLGVFWIIAGFTNPFITSIGSAAGLAIARQRARLA